jgi:hypothetical protein
VADRVAPEERKSHRLPPLSSETLERDTGMAKKRGAVQSIPLTAEAVIDHIKSSQAAVEDYVNQILKLPVMRKYVQLSKKRDKALLLIESMPEAERDRFFDLVAQHPDKAMRGLAITRKIWTNRVGADEADQWLRRVFEQRTGHRAKSLRGMVSLVKLMAQEHRQVEERLSKQRRCEEARREPTRRREELIWQMWKAGKHNAKEIWRDLKREHGIEVALKTVQNDLVIVRKICAPQS